MKPINLAHKLSLFDSEWDPKVVKFSGEFPFHEHESTDEFFLVLQGGVTKDFDDAPSQTFGPGALLIVPVCEPNSGDAARAPAAKDKI